MPLILITQILLKYPTEQNTAQLTDYFNKQIIVLFFSTILIIIKFCNPNRKFMISFIVMFAKKNNLKRFSIINFNNINRNIFYY